MKSIKLWEGITVIIDGRSQTVESPADLWEILGITDKKFPGQHDLVEEMQRGVTRQLYCFGMADLSDAYPGHTVMLSVVPAKREEEEK